MNLNPYLSNTPPEMSGLDWASYDIHNRIKQLYHEIEKTLYREEIYNTNESKYKIKISNQIKGLQIALEIVSEQRAKESAHTATPGD